jgi:uncharacterized membrane protein
MIKDTHMQEVPSHSVQSIPSGGRWRVGWAANILRGVIGALAVLVALISYRYLFDFPAIPPGIASNRYRPVWLTLHAGFAATALLIGAVQFSKVLRQRKAWIHRWVGRVYLTSCLVGAMAGLVLATGSSSGAIASIGFGGLAIAWIVTNVLGWYHAREWRFAAHRRWMIRSWALTLSAVTLRLYIPLAEAVGLPELPAYQAIAFLCWLPNLVLAEVLLRSGSPGIHGCPAYTASRP